MQYWLSIGDGKSYGPYEVAQLQQMAGEGRLNAQSQLCAVGGSTWVPASSVVATHSPSYPQQGAGTAVSGGPWTPVSLVGPILTTVFCCLIGGIVSLVYASSANTKGASGDLAGAQRAAAASRTWMNVSIAIGVIICFLYLIAAVMAGS